MEHVIGLIFSIILFLVTVFVIYFFVYRSQNHKFLFFCGNSVIYIMLLDLFGEWENILSLDYPLWLCYFILALTCEWLAYCEYLYLNKNKSGRIIIRDELTFCGSFLLAVGAIKLREPFEVRYLHPSGKIRFLHPFGFIIILFVYVIFVPVYCLLKHLPFQEHWNIFNSEICWW